MAVSGTAQEDITPRANVQNLQCSSCTMLQSSAPSSRPNYSHPHPCQRRTHCLITTKTVQRRFFFFYPAPHGQGLELSLQGCSRGDDCSHFCVTRLPLTSQLGCFFVVVVFRRNLRRCNNLRTFCLFVLPE